MLRPFLFTVGLFASSLAFALEPIPKLSPPGPLDQQAGIKSVHEVMGEEIARAKSADEKSAVSAKLLALAHETKGNHLARWGAFCESIRLANEAANAGFRSLLGWWPAKSVARS